MTNIDNLTIGVKTEEKKKLEAKPVVVVNTSTKENPGKKEQLQLFCQHPDSEKVIEIRNLKFVNKEGRLAVQGLWVSLDAQGNLSPSSNIATLLKFYKKNTVKELVGTQLLTVADDSGYLVIKCYD